MTLDTELRGQSEAGRREGGFALVLTVWALAVLALVAGEVIYSSRLRVRADSHWKGQVQAYGLALAGYHAALDALGPDLRALSRGEDGRLVLHESLDDEGSPAEASQLPLGEGTYSWVVEDEDGKIDINRQGREVITAVLREAGMQMGSERDGLADAILDWRDPNREHRLNGAEEDFYRGLERPYSSKDGPLDSLEELLLIRGMREEYFYGTGEGPAPLRNVLTVYPVTFNPSTAPPEVLKALKRPSPPRPGRVSQYYTVTAFGEGTAGGVRAVRAVVLREARGSKIRFRLLYWNDNFPLRTHDNALG